MWVCICVWTSSDAGMCSLFSMVHVLHPPQGGVLPAYSFMRTNQPVFQPSSLLQPVWMGPPGSQRTQVCVCVCMRACVCVRVHVYACVRARMCVCCTLLPMVCVGFPTGWCVTSPCVQWDKSTCPSAFFPCTASTDDTTWISTITGLCVVWVWMCNTYYILCLCRTMFTAFTTCSKWFIAT